MRMSEPNETYMSIAQAKREFKVSRQAVYKAIDRGDLHVEEVAGRKLLLRHEIYMYNWRGLDGVRPSKAKGRAGK